LFEAKNGRFVCRGLLTVGLIVAFLAAAGLMCSAIPDPAEARSKRHQVTKRGHTKAPRRVVKKRGGRERTASRRGVQARALYCLNLGSNKTLLARNPDKQLPIASLTKLMTALVAMEKMHARKRVRVPSYIRKVPRSRVGLRPGDIVTVKDLIHGLLIGSGNDCAETLAGAYPGGRKKFIRTMNRKARALGARHTKFYTPSGLDRRIVLKRKGKRVVRVLSNVSTAREIGLIAKRAFARPEIRRICLKKRYVLSSRKWRRVRYRVRNTNRLVRGNLPLDAGKTGYTCRAGHCLATKFSPGKRQFLIVVLGSPDHFRDTRLIYRRAIHKTRQLEAQKKRRRTAQPQHRARTLSARRSS
jgi:D-alanyl-D-alanine carboxypeptidase